MNIADFKAYCSNPKNKTMVDVGLFIILILSFHFIYLGWQALEYWPINDLIMNLFDKASALLFDQSCWVLNHVFGIDIATSGRSIAAVNCEGYYSHITIAPECTSLKQWLHWLFLMLLFPGPWKHKVWYIPLGLIIIELINVIRVSGILMLLLYWPDKFDFFHDYLFKTFFYVVIFLMWVVWTEKFNIKKK